MLDYSIENKFHGDGISLICGCDEAGRGPLFGPVVAAACILPDGLVIDGLNDSKKLSPKKRELLYDVITKDAVSYGVASASVEEIDRLNILEASLLAMRRAIALLDPRPELALIDGNVSRDFDVPAVAVVGGDAKSPNIAAASILAKVKRDRMMVEYDREYPGYGLAKHKGYGTKEHIAAIERLGPTPLHRPLFIRGINIKKDGKSDG